MPINIDRPKIAENAILALTDMFFQAEKNVVVMS